MYVKDHPNGIGFLPMDQYKQILNLPNVRYINPSENGKKLFENKTFRQVFFKNIGLHYNRSGERFETSKYDVAATLALKPLVPGLGLAVLLDIH